MDMFNSYGHIKKPKFLLNKINKITDFFYDFILNQSL